MRRLLGGLYTSRIFSTHSPNFSPNPHSPIFRGSWCLQFLSFCEVLQHKQASFSLCRQLGFSFLLSAKLVTVRTPVCISSPIVILLCFSALKKNPFLGFPGGAVVKIPPANAGDTGSIPGLGRSHMPRSN